MLTKNLRKLESDGIVIRSDLSDTILQTEYDLSEGPREAVCALLDELAKWPVAIRSSTRTVAAFGTTAPGFAVRKH